MAGLPLDIRDALPQYQGQNGASVYTVDHPHNKRVSLAVLRENASRMQVPATIPQSAPKTAEDYNVDTFLRIYPKPRAGGPQQPAADPTLAALFTPLSVEKRINTEPLVIGIILLAFVMGLYLTA